MRTVPSHLLTSNTLCVLTKITREDGTILRLTSCDVDVIVTGDGTYVSSNFISASSVSTKISTGVDNLEIIGAIDSSLILEEEVSAGLFRNARIIVSVCDYTDPDAGTSIAFSGRIGEANLSEGGVKFTLELLSLIQLLYQKTGVITSPDCQCKRLGDAQCKFNTAGSTVSPSRAARVTKTITAVTSKFQVTFGSETVASGYFTKGVVEFTSGVCANQSFEIKRHTLTSGEAVIDFRDELPYLPSIGDTAVLEVGCMRRFSEDCVTKFGNGINFHGFPHIPGTDTISQVYRPG